MTIIELMGYPGSGKTTLLTEIKLKNSIILTTEKFYIECSKINKLKKIKHSLFWNIKNIKFVFLLMKYVILHGIPKIYCIRRIIEIIKYISLYEIILEKYNQLDIVIFDQGIIQYIWSLEFENYTSPLKDSKELKELLHTIVSKYPIKVIYSNIESSIAATRSVTRKGDCPLDSLSFEQVKLLYNLHNNDWKLFKKYLKRGFEMLDSSEDILTDIQKILGA